MEPDNDRSTTPQSVKPSLATPPVDVNTDNSPEGDTEESQPLSETKPAWTVILVITGILMSLFLVALDRTIVSTVRMNEESSGRQPCVLINGNQAIPEITNEFNSLGDYGWYGSAYMLSCCALQLLFGKLFTFFSVRYTLFLSVLTFEVASAICGVAPSSTTLVIGRAIAGIGAAGIFAGAVC